MMTFIVSGRMGTICRNVGCCSKVEMKFWYATKTLVMSSLPRMVVVNSAISLSEMPSLTLVCVVATSYPRVEKYSPPLRPKAYTTRSSFFRSRSRSSLSTLRTTPLLSAPASPLSLVTTMSAVLPGRSCMSGWRAISAVPERRSKTESAAAAYERPESARSCAMRIFTAETASIACVTVPVFLYETILVLMLFKFAMLCGLFYGMLAYDLLCGQKNLRLIREKTAHCFCIKVIRSGHERYPSGGIDKRFLRHFLGELFTCEFGDLILNHLGRKCDKSFEGFRRECRIGPAWKSSPRK